MLNYFYAGFYLENCSLNICFYLGCWYFDRTEPNRVQCDSVKCCKDRSTSSLGLRHATIHRRHTGNPYKSNDSVCFVLVAHVQFHSNGLDSVSVPAR